jgi:hypothetical protein
LTTRSLQKPFGPPGCAVRPGRQAGLTKKDPPCSALCVFSFGGRRIAAPAVPLRSASVTHENFANFASVGVQLLPVFWLVLAIETTWLKSKFRQAKTTTQKTVVANILGFSFPTGALAECLALVALAYRLPHAVEQSIGSLLLLALAYSGIAAATAMYGAVVTVQKADPPSVPDSDQLNTLSRRLVGADVRSLPTDWITSRSWQWPAGVELLAANLRKSLRFSM